MDETKQSQSPCRVLTPPQPLLDKPNPTIVTAYTKMPCRHNAIESSGNSSKLSHIEKNISLVNTAPGNEIMNNGSNSHELSRDRTSARQLDGSSSILSNSVDLKLADRLTEMNLTPDDISTHYQQHERIFMNALLKHTGIALGLITILATYSLYAHAEKSIYLNQLTTRQTPSLVTMNDNKPFLDPSIHYVPNRSVPTAIQEVDLTQYAGTWYEIARLPMYFQRKCAFDVTATYGLIKDDQGNLDKVDVLNECRKSDDSVITAEGVAVPATDSSSQFRVTFLPKWLRWLPVGKADYWILALEDGYNSALVGTPDTDYLWILSREPNLSKAKFDTYKAIATAQGYNLNSLQVSPHSGESPVILDK